MESPALDLVTHGGAQPGQDPVPAPRHRRRVRLVPVPPVPVEFTGERAGEGPLTMGQLNIHMWLSEMPSHLYALLCAELPVPAAGPAGPVTLADAAGAIAALVARHEGLRTTYRPPGQPRQHVAASGVQPLEVCSLGEGQWGPEDRPAVAEALLRWLRESPDPQQRAMRVVVAIAPAGGDQVIACAAAFSHLAADQAAIELLKRDFAALLAPPGGRPLGPPGHQPLDQAELETTPAERAKAQAALAYVREQAWRIPHCLYALPGARPSGQSLAVELSSPAAAMAVRHVAARTRASRSSVVLAALCAVVARRAGYGELVLPMSSSDRFEPHLANYVGTLAQGSMATIETDGRSLDELVRHTWLRALEASRQGRYDAARRDAGDRVIARERGLRLNYDPFFNSLLPESWSALTAGVSVAPEEAAAALARTTLRWRPMPPNESPIRFTLGQVDGCLRLDLWCGDDGLLPRAEAESLLLAAERLLVTAGRGDVPASRMPEVTRLAPLAQPAGRILVDHCWVDVADVQRLLDEAVAPATGRVFAAAADRPLVAYLAATGGIRTPQQAHARCLAALAGHPTAITPRYYVICPAAPADPAGPAAWPPPLAAGPGRGAAAC
ncbi:MAG TPA: hypothetical protein VH478_19335 [Trebonia sp.]|jgi:hypothetical protein|nr:hypothetical protein [Trebonia sp.]